MAQNVYECMFLLDTNKVAGDVANAETQLLSLVQKHNAEALAHRTWDERRLAYPINKHKKGLYYLMYIKTEGKNLVNIEKDMALNETIVRSMFLKIEVGRHDAGAGQGRTRSGAARDSRRSKRRDAPRRRHHGRTATAQPARRGQGLVLAEISLRKMALLDLANCHKKVLECSPTGREVAP
jgi:small subunit ribosomal protein S6